jgi:hypothetical protein
MIDFSTQIIINQHTLIIPNILPYEPHIVSGSLAFGFFYVDWIFDYLLWEYIKPYRNKLFNPKVIKEGLKQWIKEKII